MVESSTTQPSLNTILPELSAALGLTQAQIYERQRLLVKGGLLVSKKGMGPGTGVQATPHNVAVVLTTLLAVQRGDVVKRTKLLATAKPELCPCPHTGKTSFVGVLSEILAGPTAFPLTRRWWPNQIMVTRDTLAATIQWPVDEHGFSTWNAEFATARKPLPLTLLETKVILDGAFFPRLVTQLDRAGHALTGAR
jgi:hypothetical protein